MTAREIKTMRLKLGLNQKELALALGCSKGTIENYEQGKRNPQDVYAERLEKLKRKADKLDANAGPR